MDTECGIKVHVRRKTEKKVKKMKTFKSLLYYEAFPVFYVEAPCPLIVVC